MSYCKYDFTHKILYNYTNTMQLDFVLSDTISISNCDRTVNILTKKRPFAVEVFTSSLSHIK